MKITRLRVNHIVNPVGFALEQPVFSYVVTETAGKKQQNAQIILAEEPDFENIVYDSGASENIDSIAFELPAEVQLKKAARYYWKVRVTADNGETAESGTAFFETAADMPNLSGDFITCAEGLETCEFYKETAVKGKVTKARAYVTSLGNFEFRIDGKKVGNEYLTPYCNNYDRWQQVITFDVTEQLTAGDHEVSMAVVPGWYAGVFGFNVEKHIYGDKTAAFVHIDLEYEDGSKETFVTDETWQSRESAIRFCEIYDGEIYDPTFKPEQVYGVKAVDYDKTRLSARRSLPVIVKETIKPKRILTTPAGETVVDMGQNMVGWMAFINREPAGTVIHMQHGEVLQDGNFYRENLRTAKAAFTCTSDGKEDWVRPHLTFYGFRYVKIEGLTKELCLDDLMGEVIYSDMEVTGNVKTSNPLVNRLFENGLWGQKGNFVDMPTDCPQRDERMGWTGDAQVFSGTACFNMDTQPFYAKFGYDMTKEQENLGGLVPQVVPSFKMGQRPGDKQSPGGSSAWADSATVIPWTTYLFNGDRRILEQQYSSMKMWADYIHKQDVESGNTRLWRVGFHFGDWLALDNPKPGLPTGATEQFYVASAYYFLSTTLTGKAARVIGKADEAVYYEKLAEEIRQALVDEYFTKNGRLAMRTQTGYIIALAFGFCPEEYKARVAADLNALIMEDGGKLQTGFVGTPYICKMLSEYGYNEMAYKLLLNEDLPGWLYPVRMGATTIWERWDSIMPDGHLNPAGMNSLNHYSMGSVVEWMYRYMCGLNPVEEQPGFRRVRYCPMPDYRMSHAECTYLAPAGEWKSAWTIEGKQLVFRLTVPFGCEAVVELPDLPAEGFTVKTAASEKTMANGSILSAGDYTITYVPTKAYSRCFNADDTLAVLRTSEAVKAEMMKINPAFVFAPAEFFGNVALKALPYQDYSPISAEEAAKLAEIIKNIPVPTDLVPDMIMDI